MFYFMFKIIMNIWVIIKFMLILVFNDNVVNIVNVVDVDVSLLKNNVVM